MACLFSPKFLSIVPSDKSSYKFRWASLQLELLCTLKLDDDIRSKLGRLPPKLEQLYIELYDELISCSGEAGRNIIEKTLKWLLSSQRTLSTSDLLWAIAITLETPIEDLSKETILDLCQNLVIHDEGLNTFRFAHLSVREFLEKRSEFSEISCNSLTAESCLLHIIASSNDPHAALRLGDKQLSRLKKTLASTQQSASASFLAYANSVWMNHCQLASQDSRSTGSSFGCTFKLFFSENAVDGSAFDTWSQWYWQRFPEKEEHLWRLQNLLSSYSNLHSRKFFVAITYGFSEVVDSYLQNERVGDEEKQKAFLQAIIGGHLDIFDLLMNDGKIWEPAISETTNRVRNLKLLSDSRNSSLPEHLLAMAVRARKHETVALLLGKCPNILVTGGILIDASWYASVEVFSALLSRTTDNIMTENFLLSAMSGTRVKQFTLLLDRGGASCITPKMMARAARSFLDDAFMEVLLASGGAAKISEEAMIEAAKLPTAKRLNMLLLHGGQITQNVLISAAPNLREEVLHVLLEHGCVISDQVLMQAASQAFRQNPGFCILLEHADQTIVAKELSGLLQAVAGTIREGTGVINRLLDREEGSSITEDVFMAAAKNHDGGSEVMRELLDRDMTAGVTEDVVVQAVANLQMDVVLKLLACIETTDILDVLLKAAAANDFCGAALVKMLLRRSGSMTFPEKVFIEATRNRREGGKIILTLEDFFGPINMTEDRLLTLLEEKAIGEHLLRWIEPTLITEKLLVAAIRPFSGHVEYWHTGPPEYDFKCTVAERSIQVPISLKILEQAAQHGNLRYFTFFWNRGRLAKVPESLINRAGENLYSGAEIIEFLLAEAEEVSIRESLFIAIAKRKSGAIGLFSLLLGKGISVEITQDVFNAALTTPRLNGRKEIRWLLEQNPNLDVTDSFQIVASTGQEDILHELSKFLGIKDPPDKCLNVARLMVAVLRDDTATVKDLLVRGANPNSSHPCGFNPLFFAVDSGREYLGIRTLLAAGTTLESGNGKIPLVYWSAVKGHYKMVKILVEAGASVDFEDGKGNTLAMLARENGHLEVYRYLQHCEKTGVEMRCIAGSG